MYCMSDQCFYLLITLLNQTGCEKKRKLSACNKGLDCSTNSHHYYKKIYEEQCEEYMITCIRVERVNPTPPPLTQTLSVRTYLFILHTCTSPSGFVIFWPPLSSNEVSLQVNVFQYLRY